MRVRRSAESCPCKRRMRPRAPGTGRSRPLARPRCPIGPWPHRSQPLSPLMAPLGARQPRWPHALPCRFGLLLTAPATVEALRQRLGWDGPAQLRSLTTKRGSGCPGPFTVTVDSPSLAEHTRIPGRFCAFGKRAGPISAGSATNGIEAAAIRTDARPRTQNARSSGSRLEAPCGVVSSRSI